MRCAIFLIFINVIFIIITTSFAFVERKVTVGACKATCSCMRAVTLRSIATKTFMSANMMMMSRINCMCVLFVVIVFVIVVDDLTTLLFLR